MFKTGLFILLSLASAAAMSLDKPDPNSAINAQEQINNLPGSGDARALSVRTQKKSLKAPAQIAPLENTTPANCADSLGASGAANYTACQAQKKTR